MSKPVEKRGDKYFIADYEVLPCIFKPFAGLNKHECVDGYRTKDKHHDLLKGETYFFYKSGLNFCWTEDMIIEYTLL